MEFKKIMIYENKTFDEERALYGIKNTVIRNCTFDGPADGESALKESTDISVEKCHFALRYPFWHVQVASITDSTMTDTCRASLWYSSVIHINNCRMNGVKALRECDDITLTDTQIDSPEFCWKCSGINVRNITLKSEYPFFESKNMNMENLTLSGKYSFQYIENVTIRNSNLDTKDAFWHAKNVTIIDSVVKGEYLGWYSEKLTFENCHIIGTQPLCYAKNLKIKNCTMESCDLSFEYSDVEAEIKGSIKSVKNPLSGTIKADSIGNIILESSTHGETSCKIIECGHGSLKAR